MKNQVFLTPFCKYVKRISCLLLFILSPLCFGDETEIVLAKGEQRSISVPGLKNFSIGNKEVLSVKFMKDSQKILLKAKSIGFSDLMLFSPKSGAETPQTYKVYVFSKKQGLQLAEALSLLQEAKIQAKLSGSLIVIAGIIDSIEQYRLLQKIRQKLKDQIFSKAQLASTLKKKILEQLYLKLFAQGLAWLECYENYATLSCYYPKAQENLRHYLDQLETEFFVEFSAQESEQKEENFKLKMKILQVERLDGREIGPGLDQIYGRWKDIFQMGLKGLIAENEIFFRENRLKAQTLAEPEFIIRLQQKSFIELGSYLPYSSLQKEGNSNTEWFFAGLKIKVLLKNSANHFILDYQTTLSRPQDKGSIAGNKQQSSIGLELGQTKQLFHLVLKTHAAQNQQIPLIAQIPLLGQLFRSSRNHQTHKSITAFIQLSKE